MKAKVCERCDNYDAETEVCARYNRPIGRINACSIAAAKSFHKPFTRRGVDKVIEYRQGNTSPLRLGKEAK